MSNEEIVKRLKKALVPDRVDYFGEECSYKVFNVSGCGYVLTAQVFDNGDCNIYSVITRTVINSFNLNTIEP